MIWRGGLRRALALLAGLLASELALVFITRRSLLGSSVGTGGFALRAALLALLVLVRFRALAAPGSGLRGGRLLLVLMLLPTLVQFQASGGRLSGVDSISYYVFLRSMVKDRDFNLVNEYIHYGMITRWDLAVTTKTGHRRSIYSVGPAVVWTPLFLAGEGLARLAGWITGEAPDLSGYGPYHVNSVALGSFLYGCGALLLIHALLRRHFEDATATAAVLLVWLASFFHWYLVVQPTYAHSASTLVAAYALWLWERARGGSRGAWGHFFLGVILGLAMCIRWQNGVLLILPGLELLGRVLRTPRGLPRLAGLGGLLLAGTLLGAFPQLAAWKALYDMWVLPYPPQGTDFLRLDHPWILETLFSSRHGLLSWTPALWLGYLGFLPLLRRRPALAWPLAVALGLMSYVNFCVGDWWGGASFSNRRFDSALPLLALGTAASIDVLRSVVRRRPAVVLATLAVLFAVWNLALVEQVRRGLVPRDDSAAFPRLAGGAARVISDAVGFPTTWPASWLFALRHHRPPGQYDLLVGRYLFYRQNSLNGHIEIGAPGDDVMLGEGWGPTQAYAEASARRVRGRARVFAPLDVPEDLEIRCRAAAEPEPREVAVLVNGREAGRFRAEREWAVARLPVPAAFWRRELNEVTLDAGGGEIWVDALDFGRIRRQQ